MISLNVTLCSLVDINTRFGGAHIFMVLSRIWRQQVHPKRLVPIHLSTRRHIAEGNDLANITCINSASITFHSVPVYVNASNQTVGNILENFSGSCRAVPIAGHVDPRERQRYIRSQ
jgi:hypothetical protein